MNGYQITPGLVSITLRQLTVAEIVSLSVETGLKSIEWGGDVHVPVGNLGAAKQARDACADAGLEISSFGSYVRVTDDDPPFEQVLETAIALGAPSIRVWAGRGGSVGATERHRQRVASVIAQAADEAAAEGVAINLEYHRDTLTDTVESALQLLGEIADRRAATQLPVRTYYQTGEATAADEAVSAVRQLGQNLVHLHVFSWDVDGRLPLAARDDLWLAVLGELAAAKSAHRTYHAQIEHVVDDDPAALRRDAATLLRWIDDLEIAECRP